MPDALVTGKASELLDKLEKAWTDGPGKSGSGMPGKTLKVEFKLHRFENPGPSPGELSLWPAHS